MAHYLHPRVPELDEVRAVPAVLGRATVQRMEVHKEDEQG